MKIELFDKIEEIIDTLINVVEQTDDNIMVTDKKGVIKYINRAFERTTGYSRAEVIGKTPKILRSGKHGKDYYERLWTTILAGKTFRATTTNKNKKGELYYADQTITSIKDDKGNILNFVSVWKDVTERINAEEQMKALNKSLQFEKYKLEQILSFDEKVSAITKLDKLIDFIIKKSCDILESKRCSLMLIKENTKEICIKGAIGLSTKYLKKSHSLQEGVIGIVAKTGESLLVENVDSDKRIGRKGYPSYKSKSFMCVPIKFNNKLIGIVNITDKDSAEGNVYTELDLRIMEAIVREAAVAIENAEIYKELKYLTVTDPLTIIYNFRYFTTTIDYEIKRSERFGKKLSLLMMDVDNFKDYNDTFGHLEGDFLLKSIGEVLATHLREIDVACRYAGDEFVVILPETDDIGAMVVAEKIKDAVFALKLKKRVSLSIGVTKYSKGMTRHDLTVKADRALYKAKHEGKNRICLLS